MPAASTILPFREKSAHKAGRLVLLFAFSISVSILCRAAADAQEPTGKSPPAQTPEGRKAEGTGPVAKTPSVKLPAKESLAEQSPTEKTSAEKALPAKTPAKTADKSEKDKIPEPEEQSLVTSDGVHLSLTYYPSNRGREAVPVVLLHMSQGSRTDYKSLAATLQSQGYAVIVPDLRGHGASTKQKTYAGENTLSATKLPVGQYQWMVDGDMYAIKEYLWHRNNAKELNLNKLCVIGAEMGASVAMNFTALDSTGYMKLGDSDRGPFYGPLQLGRFVKALVLLSPEFSYKGLPLELSHAAFRELSETIPLLILVGKEDGKSYNDAERVAKIFKRLPPKKIEDTTYFFNPLVTKLQGTHLLESKSLNADKMICQFLQLRIVEAEEAKSWTWKTLKKPHE